jgi:hypothetical protein
MADPKADAAPAPKILVINHTGSVYRIPIQASGKKPTDRPVALAYVVLLPGVNAVDADEWDLVKDAGVMPALLKLKGRGGFELGDSRLDLSSLAGIKDEEEAIALVEETVGADLLKSWQRTEKRKAVLDAIEEQLAAIDPRNDKAASDAAEGESK